MFELETKQVWAACESFGLEAKKPMGIGSIWKVDNDYISKDYVV